MENFDNEDTIAAIATPIGIGGVAVIRVSGKEAIGILRKIFVSYNDVNDFISWRVYYGKILDKGREIDEVLATVFKRPRSYTKEDMVEISCHGGAYVSKRILELVINSGARLAEPGEFTKRAFLNGRIDLSQAEAVAELIHAKTEISLQTSLEQLEGNLYRKINYVRNELIDSCSLLEIELDFSEEDLEFVNRETLLLKLDHVLSELELLIKSYDRGKVIREGVKLVIVGKPNVGKSSLLNALLKEDRAIVTEIPGTTRDFLEEQLNIKGVLFRAIDTAGIVETDNIIEQQGINRTQRHLDHAQFIIHILDSSENTNREDLKIVEKLRRKIESKKAKIIVVLNKIDLERKIKVNELYYKKVDVPIVETSAKEYIGIDKLENTLYENIMNDFEITGISGSEVVITKVRHLDALKRATKSIKKALLTTQDNLSSEFITLDLRDALDSLGEIIGVVTSEDILNNIFEKFCIGK